MGNTVRSWEAASLVKYGKSNMERRCSSISGVVNGVIARDELQCTSYLHSHVP